MVGVTDGLDRFHAASLRTSSMKSSVAAERSAWRHTRSSGTFKAGRSLSLRYVTPSSGRPAREEDRKSTRLNSIHANISYAGLYLKKKIDMSGIGLTTVNGLYVL